VFPQNNNVEECGATAGKCSHITDVCLSVATCVSTYGHHSACCNSSYGACRACTADATQIPVPVCVACRGCDFLSDETNLLANSATAPEPYFEINTSLPNSESCKLEANGACITDGDGPYGTDEFCRYRMVRTGVLVTGHILGDGGASFDVNRQWGPDGNDGFRLAPTGTCADSTVCGADGCPCETSAFAVHGQLIAAGASVDWMSDSSPLTVGDGYSVCGVEDWILSFPTACPLPRFSRRPGVFNFTLIETPITELDRAATDMGDLVNSNLTVGEIYRFLSPSDSADTSGWSRYFSDYFGNVTYSLALSGTAVVTAANDVLLNTKTAFLQIAPSAEYTVQVQVLATDSGGDSVLLRNFTFTSYVADIDNTSLGPGGQDCVSGNRIDAVRYDAQYTCNCSSTTFTGDLCDIPPQLDIGEFTQYLPAGEDREEFVFQTDNRTKWAQDETYRLPPINVSAVTLNGAVLGIRYALIFDTDPPPRGFFIDSNTGEASMSIPSSPATHTATLLAQAQGTIPQELYNITFEFLPKDESNPSFGPNNRSCTQGEEVDTVEFDQSFTCNCPNNTLGPNCDPIPPSDAASSGNEEEAKIAYITVGVLAFICGAILLVSRYQVYRARNTPRDLSGLQQDILQGLGMSSAAFDIADDEFGLTFTFSKSLAEHADKDDIDVYDLGPRLLASLRKLKGLPPRLTAMLSQESTTVKVDLAAHCALIRMKRPTVYKLKPRAEEDFAAALHQAAVKRKVSIEGGDLGTHFAEDVAVAVPQRIPKELNRLHLTRLGLLGEGNYGYVFKGTYKSAGSIAINVAVKTLKTADESARDELLTEAALMALLEHNNIVSMVGIITVPRNMPAVLVLELCDHGTLKDYVSENDHHLDDSMLLTFCHDVASGMHYLSSRRIVHRDVAARNVLLDATMVCKVSDFGMSTALAGGKDDSDYAANYVKMQGELPVRWSAIEVLGEAKYSKASDVWAYGILVFEVMSRGQTPYAEFATLAEVAEQVKSGYIMHCPKGCRLEVYETVMKPCWDSVAKDRPGFGHLCDVLVDLGAVPAQGDMADMTRQESLRDVRESTWKRDFDDRHLLGPSVHHMVDVLCSKVFSAVKKHHWGHTKVEKPDTPKDATILHTVEVVAKPAGRHRVCPRDGEKGCAYVDTLTKQDDVGRANALLSYTWSYRVVSVASALQRWCDRRGRNPKRTYIWICSLCLNQHRIGQQVVSPEELANEFGPRVQAIGRVLPMLDPWRNPSYLTRAWCLFELYTAIGEKGKVDIDIILTEEEHSNFVQAMMKEGYSCIDKAVAGIESEDATAYYPADLDAIRTIVKSKPGGFSQLNSTVKQHLHRWFESQGAVRSAERLSRPKKYQADDEWRKSGMVVDSSTFSEDKKHPFYALAAPDQHSLSPPPPVWEAPPGPDASEGVPPWPEAGDVAPIDRLSAESGIGIGVDEVVIAVPSPVSEAEAEGAPLLDSVAMSHTKRRHSDFVAEEPLVETSPLPAAGITPSRKSSMI